MFEYTRFAVLDGPLSAWGKASQFPRLAPAYTPLPDLAKFQTSSATTIAFETLGRVVRVKRSDLSWARASTGKATVPFVVHDDVFVRDSTPSWYRLSRVEADGEVVVVRDKPLHHVFGLTYDGSSLYWIELSGGVSPTVSQTHFELWRASYTRDIAALNSSAELVVALDGTFNYGYSMVHDGVFATSIANQALVIRLSDKRVRMLPAAADVSSGAFYVDRNDLWVSYETTKPVAAHYAKVTIDW